MVGVVVVIDYFIIVVIDYFIIVFAILFNPDRISPGNIITIFAFIGYFSHILIDRKVKFI